MSVPSPQGQNECTYVVPCEEDEVSLLEWLLGEGAHVVAR